MQLREFKPQQSLSPYIEAYWEVTSNGHQAAPGKIIPDGCVDIIVNLGEDLCIDTAGITLKNGRAYLGGAITRYMQSRLPAAMRMVGVRFRPAAFSHFYSFSSLHEATNTFIALDKQFVPDPVALESNATGMFDAFFLKRLKQPRHRLLPLIGHIQQCKGRISVNELAAAHFITERQLEREFRYHTGLSPKTFTGIVRYRHAWRLIKEYYPGRDLSDIAIESGYYDQAHLSNEIRKYTGLAPSAL